MELNKEIIISIQDAQFTFKDCEVSTYFDIMELRSKQDGKGLIEITKRLLVGINNLTHNGNALSVDEFKQMDIPASLAFSLLKRYCDAVGESITAESVEAAEKEIKNVQ